MNKLLTITLAILLIIIAVQAHKGPKCTKKCLTDSLEIKDEAEAEQTLKACLKGCKAGFNPKKKQLKTAVVEIASDSTIGAGVTLQTTTTVNVRNGACTNKGIVVTLQPGQTVKTTGWSGTDCGYTWYGVQGSFGYGYVASNFVKVVGPGPAPGPSPSPSPSGDCKPPRSYVLFKQCDSRWGSNYISTQTVCQVGCLMSSVSMALNARNVHLNGQEANPGTLNAWLKSNGGYSGNLFVWGSVAKFDFHYQGQPTNINDIKTHFCKGNVVILNVNNGGHWVLATGLTSSGFTVNDPGFQRSSYGFNEVVRAGVYALG
jgi:hypothetical protein